MKGRVKCTNKMSFIKKEEVPQNIFRDVTYGRVVCDIREGKPDKNRTGLIVGGGESNTLATAKHPRPVYGH